MEGVSDRLCQPLVLFIGQFVSSPWISQETTVDAIVLVTSKPLTYGTVPLANKRLQSFIDYLATSALPKLVPSSSCWASTPITLIQHSHWPRMMGTEV